MTPNNNILQPIVFASKSISSAKKRYSNIEKEELGILHGLEKLHHYCLVTQVSIITDHKPLLPIFKKDIATLFQRLQWILLRMHQYRVKIYKPGSDLFMADWLSRKNHKDDRGKEIEGMQVSINIKETSTNIPECMMICNLQHEIDQDNHLQQLKECIIKGWPAQNLRPCWTFWDAMAVIDWVILNGRCIVIFNTLSQALEQLHINHMGIEKNKTPCVNQYISQVLAAILQNCSTCLEFQQTKPKEKIMHHKIPRKPWKVVGAYMFTLHNKTYLCIVDYHSKFPIIKKTEDLAADSLILACKIIFFRIWPTKKNNIRCRW